MDAGGPEEPAACAGRMLALASAARGEDGSEKPKNRAEMSAAAPRSPGEFIRLLLFPPPGS